MIRDQRERYHADLRIRSFKNCQCLERGGGDKRDRQIKTRKDNRKERRGRKIRRIRKKIREETNHTLREREKKRERWFGLSVWKEGERRERRKVR